MIQITIEDAPALKKTHFKNITSFLNFLEEDENVVVLHEQAIDDLSPEVKEAYLQAKKDIIHNPEKFISI